MEEGIELSSLSIGVRCLTVELFASAIDVLCLENIDGKYTLCSQRWTLDKITNLGCHTFDTKTYLESLQQAVYYITVKVIHL